MLLSAQKKINIVSAAVIAVFLIFLFFVYLPAQKTVARLKAELEETEGRIQEIESLLDKTKPLAENITMLKARYKELSNKFPEREEEALRALSDLARNLNVEIISLRPSPKRLLLGQEDKALLIEGKSCRFCAVTVEMRCDYANLVEYIEAVHNELPAVVTVQSLRALKENQDVPASLRVKPKLKVTLTFNLYLLS